VRALRAWLDVRGAAAAGDVVFGRIDRHGNIGASLTPMAIATIVRERAALADVAGDFAAHSLRAGFATSAARAGHTEAAIMRHGRWKSVQVARRYIRHGSRWLDNPAAAIGL
jgi:integrase